MDKQANIHLRNASGATALHLAAGGGKSTIVQFLYEHDGNIDLFSKDYEGSTPIDSALSSGYKDIASQIAYYSCVQHYSQVSR